MGNVHRFWLPGAVVAAATVLQQSPIVQGRDVTFVAGGDPSDPPRIVADFNGWTPGAMTPSGDGRTYTLRVALDPAARIEYLIAYRDRFTLDPLNPLTVPAPAGPPRSELRMPAYVAPRPLPATAVHGAIEEISVAGTGVDHWRVRVYMPAAHRSPTAILYAYDGDVVVDQLALPSMLDSLIEHGDIAPVVAVFIDPLDRHDDFEPGSPFRAAFIREIVPAIERRYRAARSERVLMGLSRSTVGAMDACVNGGVAFDACALVAPAVSRRYFVRVLPPPASTTRFLIETGTYDVPLVDDARALRDELLRRGAAVQYVESPEGHNHTAFRARLPSLLMRLFPSNPRHH